MQDIRREPLAPVVEQADLSQQFKSQIPKSYAKRFRSASGEEPSADITDLESHDLDGSESTVPKTSSIPSSYILPVMRAHHNTNEG